MEYFAAAILGVVQGLTEFLPVSSSAHLILARAFFGWESERLGLAFDVACHLGTLAAVLWYFRRDLMAMAAAAPAALLGAGGERGHLVRLVVAGTVPIVVIGLLAADWFETLREPWICAVTLTVGAIGMMTAERWRASSRSAEGIGVSEALAIGVGQALALFPGMSRSGTTITIAMFLGIRRQDAARFTFLMSVPAVVAAVGREGLVLAESGVDQGEAGLFVVGIAVSAVVGYLAISRLIRYLAGHSLDVFAHYRYALAAATVVWLVVR